MFFSLTFKGFSSAVNSQSLLTFNYAEFYNHFKHLGETKT